MPGTLGNVVLVLDDRRSYGIGEIASWPQFRSVVDPQPQLMLDAPPRKFIDFSPPVEQNNRASRRRAAALKRRKP